MISLFFVFTFLLLCWVLVPLLSCFGFWGKHGLTLSVTHCIKYLLSSYLFVDDRNFSLSIVSLSFTPTVLLPASTKHAAGSSCLLCFWSYWKLFFVLMTCYETFIWLFVLFFWLSCLPVCWCVWTLSLSCSFNRVSEMRIAWDDLLTSMLCEAQTFKKILILCSIGS